MKYQRQNSSSNYNASATSIPIPNKILLSNGSTMHQQQHHHLQRTPERSQTPTTIILKASQSSNQLVKKALNNNKVLTNNLLSTSPDTSQIHSSSQQQQQRRHQSSSQIKSVSATRGGQNSQTMSAANLKAVAGGSITHRGTSSTHNMSSHKNSKQVVMNAAVTMGTDQPVLQQMQQLAKQEKDKSLQEKIKVLKSENKKLVVLLRDSEKLFY